MKKSVFNAASVCVAAVLSALAFSCATLPVAPNAADEAADRQAIGALPPKAVVFAVLRPALAPALAESVEGAMPAAQEPRIRDILSHSRAVWASLSPGTGEGPTGRGGIFYALLSGRYPGALLRSGLASAKGAAKKEGYVALPDGTKVAVPSDAYILITNADMDSFLARFKSPGARIEGSEAHPAWDLIMGPSDAAGAPPPGLALLVAEPASLRVPPFSEGFAEIPLRRIEARGSEKEARILAQISFTFDSDNSARIFSPAARMLGLGGEPGRGAGGQERKRGDDHRHNAFAQGYRRDPLELEGKAPLSGGYAALLGSAARYLNARAHLLDAPDPYAEVLVLEV